MRFFSIATDFAFDRAALSNFLDSDVHPIWRRFDARQLTWAEYLVEAHLGAGRLLAATLRFEGGLGQQPASFDANPMGTHLLISLLNLQSS
jgi:hypothetical protein